LDPPTQRFNITPSRSRARFPRNSAPDPTTIPEKYTHGNLFPTGNHLLVFSPTPTMPTSLHPFNPSAALLIHQNPAMAPGTLTAADFISPSIPIELILQLSFPPQK